MLNICSCLFILPFDSDVSMSVYIYLTMLLLLEPVVVHSTWYSWVAITNKIIFLLTNGFFNLLFLLGIFLPFKHLPPTSANTRPLTLNKSLRISSGVFLIFFNNIPKSSSIHRHLDLQHQRAQLPPTEPDSKRFTGTSSRKQPTIGRASRNTRSQPKFGGGVKRRA